MGRWTDMYGRRMVEDHRTAGMTSPVRCAHCDGIYDLGTVEVTARYTDCSLWNAPCCGRPVDDRGETGWKTRPDYHRLERRTRMVQP